MGATIPKGVVFDIKKYATDDGPGIRTTVFFKGCPLRCQWCHNPEGQSTAPELMYRKKRCTGCGECVEVCPSRAIMPVAKAISVERKACLVCGMCAEKCPTDALGIVGKEMGADDVMKEIEKDKLFYDQSNGGVTVSGGEPLAQLAFLVALLEKCKGKNIHTAVDTCGFAPHKAFGEIRDKVDVFLYDLKIIDERKHSRYCGASNELILENLKKLAECGSDIRIRFPVIPGINDDEENIAGIGELMLESDIQKIHVLPYHRAGTEKYISLGRIYRLNNIKSPTDKHLKLVKEKFESFGLDAKIGG